MTSREDESHECHLWCLARTRLDGRDRGDVYAPQGHDRLVGDTCEYGGSTYYRTDIFDCISLYHVRQLTPGGVFLPRDCALPDVEHIQSGCVCPLGSHVLTVSYHDIWYLVLRMDTRARTRGTHSRRSVFLMALRTDMRYLECMDIPYIC